MCYNIMRERKHNSALGIGGELVAHIAMFVARRWGNVRWVSFAGGEQYQSELGSNTLQLHLMD